MVIDLDVAPVRPVSVRVSGRLRFGAIVVAALVLAVAGGAAPVARLRGPVLTLGDPGLVTSLLTAEALYTVRTGDGDTTTIEAHPLVPHGPGWTAEAEGGARPGLTEEGSTLVLEASDAGVTTFLDARTGRVRWSLPDRGAVRVFGDRVADWRRDSGRMLIRELATGAVLWSRPAAAFTGDDNHVVIVDEKGGAAVYAAADGREVTARPGVDLRRTVDFPAPYAAALIEGERLFVFGDDHIAGFRLADLTRLWLVPVASPFAVGSCGDDLLCTVAGSAGLTVLDAGTGAVRWTGPQWRRVEGAILSEEDGHSARVDLATGRVERDFGRGSPVGDLMLYAEGRTLVLGQTDGRVLAALPGITPGSCRAAGDHLACRRPDGSIAVWRVPQRMP